MQRTMPRRGYRIASALLVVALMGCAGRPSAVREGAALGDLPQRMARAQELMTQSRLTAALQVLQEIVRDTPPRPEPGYLVGECLYRMQDLDGAQAQFEALHAAFPHFQPAIHRLWLVRLARDPGVRTQIQREITIHLGERPTPEDLWTAYRGYHYVRDAKRRRDTLERLVPVAARLPQRSSIARALLEEILGAESAEQRARMAEAYLRYFGDERGIRLATRTYVRVQSDLDAGQARALLRRFPDNRHLMQALAERLTDSMPSLNMAERLLDQHLRHWRRAQVHERRLYAQIRAWRTLIRWELAHSDYVRGLVAMRRNRRAAAQVLLEQAAHNHPERWRVYAALAESSGGDAESELRYLALSVVAGNPQPEIARRLAAQYPEWRARTRLPGVTATSARFVELTQAVGLAPYRAQRVAWGDYDNDGFADLLLDGRTLLRNVSGSVFLDTALGDQVPAARRATGGVWGDVDNDGYLDMLITRRDGNRLLKNEDGRRFTDITAAAFTSPFLGRTEAAAWGDINNDGWIDLYTANYEVGGLERGLCRADQLFRNLGDGRFADRTRAAGVVTDEPHCGRGVTWSDVDQDGYQDILVSNYRLDPNLLWKNQSGTGFVEVAERWGFRGRNDGGAYGHSIGSVAADIDGDQRVDVYLSNLAHPRYLDISDTSALLLQETAGAFTDRWTRAGIDFDETSADPLLADFDNDGDLDLYVTSIYPGRVSHLYENQGDARFIDVTAYSGTQLGNAWGAAAADYDQDGYLDLFVASSDGVRLFRNLGGAHHWLGVRIRSRQCNHFGIGARIRVEYGHQTALREVTAGRGTGSQDALTAHFGLGDYDGPVTVEIRHLCGQVERRTRVAVDQVVEFR